MTKGKNLIFIFLILVPFSLFALYPSFQLGLYGDDWLALWRYFYTIGPVSHGALNYLTYFLTRYGSFELIMGLIAEIVGFKSLYYYITAYILRLIAALSFYPLVYYLTKNKVSAVLAVLFFSVTAVGLDATNWVFNMPVYIAIALFNFFLLYFVKAHEKDYNPRFYVISLLFLVLAMFTASVRMTGAVPLVLLMELFFFFRFFQLKNLKLLIIRLSGFISLFIILVIFGQIVSEFGGRSGYSLFGPIDQLTGVWKGGLASSGALLNKGSTDFILYPLIIIGNMLIPLDYQMVDQRIMLWVGIFFILFALRLIYKNRSNYLISTGFFLAFCWLICAFIFAWLKDPLTLLPFFHRYLIVSASGLTIFIAILISRIKRKFTILGVLFVSLFLILNIYSSRNYLQYQVDNLHGVEITEKVWEQLPLISEIGKSGEAQVFYFTGENRQILYGALTFGFPVHMALAYNLDDFSKMPVPLDGWEQVVSAVTDGSSLAPFDFPQAPIPIENVYAFKLEGKNRLVEITEMVREELAKIKINRVKNEFY